MTTRLFLWGQAFSVPHPLVPNPLESNRRSERTKLGLAWAIKEGKRLGRPPGSRVGRRRKNPDTSADGSMPIVAQGSKQRNGYQVWPLAWNPPAHEMPAVVSGGQASDDTPHPDKEPSHA